ncbi:hypothetical protein FQN57_000236 [Myotisia sp. PD_48]|nr:hypothetical protein FQN57_000236 [Myotisia sp. PD_48]
MTRVFSRPSLTLRWCLIPRNVLRRKFSSQVAPPVIKIENATFFREYPTSNSQQDQNNNPPLYPGLNFTLPSPRKIPIRREAGTESQHQQESWAVIGSSDRSVFFEILRGKHICLPPNSRSFPYLCTDEIDAKDHRLRFPGHAIRHVGFNGDAGGVRGSYLSARYESRREETDFTLLQYLKGQTSLNPLETSTPEDVAADAERLLSQVIIDLGLTKLIDMPLANLSNGQMRRARIAEALLDKPEVLLFDDPFMGLDPPTAQTISKLLNKLSQKSSPQFIISLRPQDMIPEWITHLLVLGQNYRVALQGQKTDVLKQLDIWKAVADRKYKHGLKSHCSKAALVPRDATEEKQYIALSVEERKKYDMAEELRINGNFDSNMSLLHELLRTSGANPLNLKRTKQYGEPIIQMEGVKVSYGEDKAVLGDWRQEINGASKEGLFWEVRRGQRWGVFGRNGSGKTTIVSLITSDHPQAYALPIRLFGRSRLPEPGKPGISIFDLQSRIGHSSPEVHAFFPRNLSIRASIESAWADTFLSKPKLTSDRMLDVDSALRFFEADLNPHFSLGSNSALSWADDVLFGSLGVAKQRLILFIRSVVHKPDLVVLDEAFSGMPRSLRDKCLHFLEVGEALDGSTGSRRTPDLSVWQVPGLSRNDNGETREIRHTGLTDSQALLVISHVKEEVPDIVSHWLRLPSTTTSAFQVGTLVNDQTVSVDAWDEIWSEA